MRRKVLSILLACFAAITANAQLHVSADGNVDLDGYMNVQQQYLSPTFPTTSGWMYSYQFNGMQLLNGLTTFTYKNKTVLNQPSNQAHYGITSGSMNSYFPMLKTTNAGGTAIVNYVELIPVLVKALQEQRTFINLLSDRLRALLDMRNASIDEATESVDAFLYQNTPISSTSQTEIRFRLPEDVEEAYIYLFGESGQTISQVPVSAAQESITIGSSELSDVYFYSLVANGQEIDTKQLVLSK